MSTFAGFSEEDLKRIKSGEAASDHDHNSTLNKKPPRFTPSAKKKTYQYKSINLQNQKIEDAIDNIKFDKCRLSIKPNFVDDEVDRKHENSVDNNNGEITTNDDKEKECEVRNKSIENGNISEENTNNKIDVKNNSVNTPDIVRGVDYAEDDLASHRAKLEELQHKQKIMEEQNKKRKEMLSKALADRTRQTEEEVMKLEKIKKELQVLDGQFSQDVGVLRKKIDLACITYSEAEKHYLKVEKEFLHAKIHLQKEKEKKELLTEHLCALITHNETRKAHKLETLMLELATNKAIQLGNEVEPKAMDEEKSSVIVDGVDQRTGKMVEMNGDS